MTRAEALALEVKAWDLPDGLLSRTHYVVTECAAALGLRAVPRVRWLHRSAASPGVFFHAHPGEIWVQPTTDLAELADRLGHELHHARALAERLSDGTYPGDRDRDEASAQRFGHMVRDRLQAGEVPIVDPCWPRPAPLPAPQRRSAAPSPPPQRQPLPTATRQATGLRLGPIRHAAAETGMRHEVWLHNGVPSVSCRSCFSTVPCGVRHACPAGRYPLRRLRDDD